MTEPYARIAAYYDTLVDRYGHHPRACDYGHPESQAAKFRVLAEVAPFDGKRVLDVGCGFADFADFLSQRYSGVQYVGVDLSPQMHHEAKRLHPGLDLRLGNFLEMSWAESFDVVMANGIFYLLGSDALRLMQQILDRMVDLAQEAVAFNSLSAWAPDREASEFYADPIQTVAHCRKLTDRLVLRHDYHPRDFTVYLYRPSP